MDDETRGVRAEPQGKRSESGTGRAANPGPLHVDPDFARQVLTDLYAYRKKSKPLTWAFLVVFGWAGGHRFYLGRTGTGLLMLFTGGGALVWWLVDAFYLNRMIAEHGAEQDRRRREGLPPLELSFMPPLETDVLGTPPPWTLKWTRRNRLQRIVRLVADAFVLFVIGVILGSLAGARGGQEAMFAAAAIILVTLLGGHVGRLDRVPLARGLIHWSHRLRLFYYYNRPGTPPGLFFRAVIGILLAPFRRRERAEAMLYIHVGAIFTVIFMMLDIMEDVGGPLLDMGFAAIAPPRLVALIFREAFMTFLLIYAFVTPIGAILNLHILTQRTHTLPRMLGGLALFATLVGLL